MSPLSHECRVPVRQVRLKAGMTVGELAEQMGQAGAYNGGALYRAICIYEKMLRDPEVTKFFGLAGAMVPAGMGGIVRDLMDAGHIDVLVSTGANLTHDIIEAIGCHHYHGDAGCSDVELRHEEINRIYDVYLPNDAFIKFEEFMQGIYSEIPEGTTVSISESAHPYRVASRLRYPCNSCKKIGPGILSCNPGLHDWPPVLAVFPDRACHRGRV